MQAEWERCDRCASDVWGEKEYRLHERTGARPTLEFNGIAGGFYGEGFKTVLPSKATSENQLPFSTQIKTHTAFLNCVRDRIAELTPSTVTTELIELEMGSPGILIDRDTPAMRAMFNAYEKGWGVKPLWSRAGGSVPVVSKFQEHSWIQQLYSCRLAIKGAGRIVPMSMCT